MKIPVVVKEWSSIPGRIRKGLDDLTAEDLLIRGGSEGWSIAEYVHHLVEANLIASHMVVAALGKPGCVYDWSWVLPDRGWMRRLSYDRAPVEPAVALLESLARHVSSLLTQRRGALKQHIALLDAPGAGTHKANVAQVLRDQVDHATGHLRDVEAVKRQRLRKR